jgi:hypothetical protein
VESQEAKYGTKLFGVFQIFRSLSYTLRFQASYDLANNLANDLANDLANEQNTTGRPKIPA